MRFVFLSILLFSFIPCFSQFKLSFETGGRLSLGQIQNLNLNSLFEVIRKDSLFEYSTGCEFLYSENENRVTNRDLKIYFQVDYKPQSTLSPFVLYQYRVNEIKDIKSKNYGLFGLKYLFLKRQRAKYSISAAILYEKTVFVSDIDEQNRIRLSIRPKLKQNISDRIFAELIFFYKPNIYDFSDYDIDCDFQITCNLLKKLLIKCVYSVEYWNKYPNPNIEKLNQNWSLRLAYSIDR